MSTEDGWVRPLFLFEEFLEGFHQEGYMITCYCLTLNSKLPLQEYHIKRALLHLLRKVPSLRVCIRPREEKGLWFHSLEHEVIDFQILENADFQKEYEDMTVHHYNSFDGPLWCARLLPLPPGSPCEMPEIRESFPHQYMFLFGFHHAITDGSSSIRISSIFVDLLNQVIGGQPINDLEQLAEFASDEQTEKVLNEVRAEMQNDPSDLPGIQKALSGTVDDVLFLKAYPPPKYVAPKTLNIAYSLSKEETSAFLKKCKNESVSFHSGFCSVVNTAIVQMLLNAGIQEEKYEIKNYHTVNYRRYWEGDTSRAFGAHLGKQTLVSEVGCDINYFWKEAREYHSSFYTLLERKTPFKEIVLMFTHIPPGIDLKAVSKLIPMGSTYYGTTNMGNLASTFPGEGEHVQVTDFRRTTSTNKNLCSHVMQTFRGRFIYGLDYGAEFMSTEIAQLYVDTIFEVLRNVTNI